MAYFHQRIRTRDLDSKPDHYIVLCTTFSTGLDWIRIPEQIVSQMVTVPILGTDLCPHSIHLNQGSESESNPVEKSSIVQESESESVSGSGNKPLVSVSVNAL